MRYYLYKGKTKGKTKNKFIVPIAIIGDFDFVVDYLWENSSEIGSLEKNFSLIDDRDYFFLDCGGPLYVQDPRPIIAIEGHRFSVPLSKLEQVLKSLSLEDECAPGYFRSVFQRAGMACNVILPINIHRKLVEKLKELHHTDEALHLELDYREALDRVYQKGIIQRHNKK